MKKTLNIVITAAGAALVALVPAGLLVFWLLECMKGV